MSLREIDKASDDYYIFGREFRKLFDDHYFLEKHQENPFRYKDNKYYYIYKDNDFVGAINYLFLNKEAYNDLLTGKMYDDMNLRCKDIASLKTDDTNYVYVSAIYIKEKYQRKGYASQLLKESIKKISEATNHQLSLLACCINDQSKDLFVRHGFNVQLINKNNDTVVFKNLLRNE